MTTSDTGTVPPQVAVGDGPASRAPGAAAPENGRVAQSRPPLPPLLSQRPTVTARRRRRLQPLWTAVLFVGLTVLGAAVFTGGAAIYTHANPREYSSEALVSVLPDPGTTVVTTTTTTTTDALSVSSDYTGIWVQIGNSDLVKRAAADTLGISESTLSDALTVAPGSASAALVSIKAATSDPAESARWANVVADQLIAQSVTTPTPGFTLRAVATATPATTVSGISPMLILGGAALIGAVVGFSVARAIRRHRRRQRAARA